jgi:hypothetical protein
MSSQTPGAMVRARNKARDSRANLGSTRLGEAREPERARAESNFMFAQTASQADPERVRAGSRTCQIM